MAVFQERLDKAKQNIKIADHMLSVTYPLLKDSKLLLAIVENIFLSYTNSIAALLYYERELKKIPPFTDSFESKFNMFRERCVLKYNIEKSYLMEIHDVWDIIIEHKKSPVEFKRRDSFVICSESYKIKTITVNNIKDYLNKAKVFIGDIDNIVGKDEGLSR